MLPSGAPETVPQDGIAYQPPEAVRQTAGIVLGGEEPGFTVDHGLGHPPDPGCNHGQPPGGGVEINEAEPFNTLASGPAGQGENIRPGVFSAESLLGEGTGQLNGKRAARGEAEDFRPVAPPDDGSNNTVADAALVLDGKPPEGFEGLQLSLPGVDAPHCQNRHRVPGSPPFRTFLIRSNRRCAGGDDQPVFHTRDPVRKQIRVRPGEKVNAPGSAEKPAEKDPAVGRTRKSDDFGAVENNIRGRVKTETEKRRIERRPGRAGIGEDQPFRTQSVMTSQIPQQGYPRRPVLPPPVSHPHHGNPFGLPANRRFARSEHPDQPTKIGRRRRHLGDNRGGPAHGRKILMGDENKRKRIGVRRHGRWAEKNAVFPNPQPPLSVSAESPCAMRSIVSVMSWIVAPYQTIGLSAISSQCSTTGRLG